MDSIVADQDWTRTKKFHSPLIFDTKALLELFLVKGKIAPVVLLLHEANKKYMILHRRIRIGSD